MKEVSTRIRALNIATLAICLTSIVGCGSDTTGTGEKGESDTTTAKPDPDDNASDAGAKEGEEEQPAATGSMCGTTMCAANNVGLPACCTAKGTGVKGDPLEFYGRGENLCGTDLGAFLGKDFACLQLSQPGVIDATCPDVETGGMMFKGCCTEEGFCGGMDTTVPLGCTYGAAGKSQACTAK